MSDGRGLHEKEVIVSRSRRWGRLRSSLHGGDTVKGPSGIEGVGSVRDSTVGHNKKDVS